jgi:hypothetical protein
MYLRMSDRLVLVVLLYDCALGRVLMVLAVAALLFQVATVQPALDTPPVETETSVTAPDTNTQPLPNLHNVKLADQPAFVNKSNSSAPLKTVAYSSSQNSQSFSTIRVPEINSGKHPEPKNAETYPSRRWLALSVVQSAAAGFDAYSTRYAVGRGAVEEDPLMRPFAHSPSIYAVSQLCPVALDFVARRMQRSPNSFIRRMWWLPQTTSTGMYLFSGVHNMHVASQLSH